MAHIPYVTLTFPVLNVHLLPFSSRNGHILPLSQAETGRHTPLCTGGIHPMYGRHTPLCTGAVQHPMYGSGTTPYVRKEAYPPYVREEAYPPYVHPGLYTTLCTPPPYTTLGTPTTIHSMLTYSAAPSRGRTTRSWAHVGNNPWVRASMRLIVLNPVTKSVPVCAESFRSSGMIK